MTPDLTLNSIRNRHGRVVRAVAVLFLLYTGGDIFLPQYFCRGEEIGGLPLSASVVTDEKSAEPRRASTDRDSTDSNLALTEKNSADSALSVSSNPSRPDQHHEQAPHTEDCFCCCAHVLPGFGISGIFNNESSHSVSISELHSLPSPPLPNTYRPPRFA
jgi:hypothetical protein